MRTGSETSWSSRRGTQSWARRRARRQFRFPGSGTRDEASTRRSTGISSLILSLSLFLVHFCDLVFISVPRHYHNSNKRCYVNQVSLAKIGTQRMLHHVWESELAPAPGSRPNFDRRRQSVASRRRQITSRFRIQICMLGKAWHGSPPANVEVAVLGAEKRFID